MGSGCSPPHCQIHPYWAASVNGREEGKMQKNVDWMDSAEGEISSGTGCGWICQGADLDFGEACCSHWHPLIRGNINESIQGAVTNLVCDGAIYHDRSQIEGKHPFNSTITGVQMNLHRREINKMIFFFFSPKLSHYQTATEINLAAIKSRKNQAQSSTWNSLVKSSRLQTFLDVPASRRAPT